MGRPGSSDLPDFSLPVGDWIPTVIYPGYCAELPDLVVGRLPATMVPSGRPGGDIKIWICETPQELASLQDALSRPILIRNGGFDFRASLDIHASGISRLEPPTAGLYIPPAKGWPWIAFFRWPATAGAAVQAQRGRYTWELFLSEIEALDYLASVASRVGVREIIRPFQQ